MRIWLPKPISAPCELIMPMRASPAVVGSVAATPTVMTRADEVERIYFGTVFELDAPKMKTPAHDRPGSVSVRRSGYYCSAPNAPTMYPSLSYSALKPPATPVG